MACSNANGWPSTQLGRTKTAALANNRPSSACSMRGTTSSTSPSVSGQPANLSPSFIPEPHQETGPELAARAVAAGAFVAIAHPQWSGLTLADARSITAAHAVEIYNHGCATGCDRPDGFAIADLLLTEGRDLTMIATDDAHFSEPDHFGGWVMVKSEANEPEALLSALKAGHFYSSQGPELRDVRIEDGHVVVECSAVSSVVAIGWGTGAKAVHGHSLTRAEVPLERLNKTPWLRVAVIDAAGKRAWSNPIRTGATTKNPRVLG